MAKNAVSTISSATWSFRTAANENLSCDFNSDGIVNALDVQLAVNQAIGISSCDSADLNRDGQCDTADVQRVVDAALGRPCRIGP